ncbi:MAG: response regulator transcription factor, partial [Anaerovoracaceae bacterium]
MKKILFVEDDRMIASGIIYALEQQGYQVTHCTGVRDAVNALRLHSFPLAILDMQLADGSGSDIIDKIDTKQTAVIFLTVVDEEEKIVRAFDQGAADYVIKPFRVRELLARVKRTLSEREPETKASDLRIGS